MREKGSECGQLCTSLRCIICATIEGAVTLAISIVGSPPNSSRGPLVSTDALERRQHLLRVVSAHVTIVGGQTGQYETKFVHWRSVGDDNRAAKIQILYEGSHKEI